MGRAGSRSATVACGSPTRSTTTIVRIDPSTKGGDGHDPGRALPGGVAVGAGSVWVANSGDGTVTRIDPRTDNEDATIAVGGSPQAITVAGGRAWVTVDAQTIPRPTWLPAAAPHDSSSQYDVGLHGSRAGDSSRLSWQLLYATCAKLLNYPTRPVLAGSRLVPEVAQSLPARSADGKSYTFTIRSGFRSRFSPPSSEPVTAQTFKYTIERTLNPTMRSPRATSSPTSSAPAPYMAGKSAHIAGVVARGRHVDDPADRAGARPAGADRGAGFCAVPSDTPADPRACG